MNIVPFRIILSQKEYFKYFAKYSKEAKPSRSIRGSVVSTERQASVGASVGTGESSVGGYGDCRWPGFL